MQERATYGLRKMVLFSYRARHSENFVASASYYGARCPQTVWQGSPPCCYIKAGQRLINRRQRGYQFLSSWDCARASVAVADVRTVFQQQITTRP